MVHLTRNDYAQALNLLSSLEPRSDDLGAFAHAAVQALGDFVAADLVTLSVCDLLTGHREVVGLPGIRLGAEDNACFDRHFFEHPLVRHHGFAGGRRTHRLSDAQSRADFTRARSTPTTTAASASTRRWRCRSSSTGARWRASC